MWDPGFTYQAMYSARVLGWHRRFSLVSTQSWGTPARPGLCAVLHKGGSCRGRVFAIDPSTFPSVLSVLDEREAAYLRREVVVVVSGPESTTSRHSAITYVENPGHPRLKPGLTGSQKAKLVRQGSGAKGSSFSYLTRTADCLSRDGHFATDAHRFLAMIRD